MRCLSIVLFAALLVTPTGSVDGDEAKSMKVSPEIKKLDQELKKDVNDRTKQLRQKINELYAKLKKLIKDIDNDHIMTPDEKFQALLDELDNHQAEVQKALLVYAYDIGKLMADKLARVPGLLPPGFILGNCNTPVDTAWWNVRGFLDKLNQKVRQVVKKQADKIEKAWAKIKQDIHNAINIFGPRLGNKPNANAGNAPDPVPPPVKVTGVAGSSGPDDDDGRAWVMGSADPTKGNVTVTLTDANGAVHTQPAEVDADGRFRVRFGPESGSGNLPEGNYKVEIAQQGVTDTRTGGIP